jgi:hypothetical protein
MFCPQCGASNADLDRYCVACGADMTPQAQGYGPAAPPQSQYRQPPYQQQYGQQQYGQPPYQQASYGSPPYEQTPYQQGPYQSTPTNHGMPVSLPTYLGWAIATLILCFWPASVVALVYGGQVNSKLARGDYNGAVHSSGRAKLWCWISFGVAIAGLILAIIGIVVAAGIARSSGIGS